jgi:hypothetical protein
MQVLALGSLCGEPYVTGAEGGKEEEKDGGDASRVRTMDSCSLVCVSTFRGPSTRLPTGANLFVLFLSRR